MLFQNLVLSTVHRKPVNSIDDRFKERNGASLFDLGYSEGTSVDACAIEELLSLRVRSLAVLLVTSGCNRKHF